MAKINAKVQRMFLLGFLGMTVAQLGSPELKRIPSSDALLDCQRDLTDPYEPQARMPVGKNANACLNVSDQRSIVMLPPEEAKPYSINPEDAVFANFRHAGNWWIAVVPKDGVEDVYAQEEHVNLAVGHTQIRFKMKEDKAVTLFPQRNGDTSAPVRLRNIVMSGEAVGPYGVDWTFGKGMWKNFVIVDRLVSMADRAKKMILEDGHLVKQYRLTGLTEEGKRQVLENVLRNSSSQNYTLMYNSLGNHCEDRFQAAFTGVTGTYKAKLAKKSPFVDRMPTLLELSLRRNGFIGSDEETPSYNEEMKLMNEE